MNSNCLEGYRCPNCGSYGPYRIASITHMIWTDDGTEYPGRTCNFVPDGAWICLDCDYHGKQPDFVDIDNDGRFKDCNDCGQTNNIDNMLLVNGSDSKGVWLCDDCQDYRQAAAE